MLHKKPFFTEIKQEVRRMHFLLFYKTENISPFMRSVSGLFVSSMSYFVLSLDPANSAIPYKNQL